MNETLSRIVADLLVKAKRGEELSSEIHRLRDELKKIIESEDTIFGKLHGLVESFQEIIPEERQRYNAAIKALSTTSKLSRQEIVTAVTNQLDELKILEKVLMPAVPNEELKVMQGKLQETRDEISKLREKIVQLENDEKALVNGMAGRGNAVELVEKGIKEVFTTIAAEITFIKSKVDEFTAESAASLPITQRDIKRDIPSEKEEGAEQKIEAGVPSGPQNTEWQRKCPMCGGRMDLRIKMWVCYSCAYEELKKDEVQGKIEEKSENSNAAKPTPHGDSIKGDILREKKGGGEQKSEISEASAPQDTEWQKKCPMCGAQMFFQISGEMWQCYSCAHEEKKDEVQSKSEKNSEQMNAPKRAQASEPISDPFPSFAVPLASLTSNEFQESKKGSSLSNNPLATKKKPCPVCRKKMLWHPMEKAWRCPSCHYERRI